jgi:microcompartment protein CcmL/EutN
MLVLGGVAAAGTAPNRSEYVTRLEAICKPRALATARATKGARGDIDAGRLAIAAGKFGQAARIFGGTVRAIAAVPRPSADTARLAQWFSHLNRQELYLKEITAQLRARHTIKAQRLTARFIHSGNLANNVVLAFGFDYCSFKFSRFN